MVFITSVKNFITIMLMFLISVQINTAFSQETISVKEVYTAPDIQEGDTLRVLAYYTNPVMGIIAESYIDLMRRQVWRPHSYLEYEGVAPSAAYWEGGIVIAKGVVEFVNNPSPFWPQDSLIGIIHIIEWEELIEGLNIPVRSKDFDKKGFNQIRRDQDCDSCKFAILIGGGHNTGPDDVSNYPEIWTELRDLFRLKVDSLGYCESNVFVHYYDGVAKDTTINQARVFLASPENIAQSHQTISSRVAECKRQGKESTFQKMINAHGLADSLGNAAEKGGVALYNNQLLFYDSLRVMQQGIIDSCATIIIDEFLQCFGGQAVDEMIHLDPKNKARIMLNSASDSQNSSMSSENQPIQYLTGKINSLNSGDDYPTAVVKGKLAYDAYLQNLTDAYQNWLESAQQWIIANPAHPNVPAIQEEINTCTQVIEEIQGMICKSKNVTIESMKEYCEWKRFVVPPGGQLVVDFKGDKKNCGNVTVYHEDPSTGEVTKKKVWNWNLPNSLLYLTGNNQRVINGDADTATAFWVHNDNGQYTITVSARGNQNLAESGSNQTEYPGFSFGGRDESSGEFFTYENMHSINIYNIDLLPLPLNILPAYMGVSYLKFLAFTFSIIPTDILWTEMALTLFVSEVISPGQFWIYTENSEQESTQIEITEPGTYNIPFGDMTISGTGGYIMMGFPYDYGGAVFSMDAWGLRTTMNVNPEIQNVTVIDGEDVCFGAPGYISTGGNGSVFHVMDGAKVKLVAGQGITLLDGTLIEQGADFIAYISTDGIYCDPPPEVLANITEPDKNEYHLKINENQSGFFRVYPNPTKGQFTLEFTEIRDFSIAHVGIFNLFGEHVKGVQVVALGRHLFDLSDKPPGVYLIRVTKGDDVGVEKVIKH
jgi:hypothetical protein